MIYTPGQAAAIRNLKHWIAGGAKHPFHLDGYAGTGKTTTVTSPEVLALLGRVAFLAPTHKAANVLREKGVDAQTIHATLYGRPETETRCLTCGASSLGELAPAPECVHEQTAAKPIFREGGLRTWGPTHPLHDFDTVLVDEVSMVEASHIEHLLRLPVRVILMGDSFQLPPVGGRAWTHGRRPDAQLTEVVRTAWDSPVLAAANLIRLGELATLPSTHPARHVPHPAHDWRDHMVICATNEARQRINLQRRHEIFGLGAGDLPRAGEPVVARANYPEIGLWNSAPTVLLDEDSRDIGGGMIRVCIDGQDHAAHLNGFTDPDAGKRWAEQGNARSDRVLRLQFAYAITGHSSQGSEWPHVTVVGSMWRSRPPLERAQWMYTAATRASRTLHVIGA